MKKISAFLVIVTLLISQNSFANSVNTITVQRQLENLNQYWIGKNINYPILKETIPLSNDVSLIQMHLSLVEQALRNKNVDKLSKEQRLNRQKCLDILHSYSAKGVFPKNLFHSKRTPYFIDKYGTACAVGQLIISTGYGEFATKVMEENNYACISELNLMYPEISEWANKFGFEIEELAWIQPCYCSMMGPGTLNVTCNGGWNGYFVPNITGLQPPYVLEYYKWDGSLWQTFFSMCGGCDLSAGNYKCTVTDSTGSTQEYFATLTEPPATILTTSQTNDNGSCNGSAIVVASGIVPGYSYMWYPGGYTNDTVTNLCHNTYTVIVTDNNNCITSATVNISLATTINENSKSPISIFPSPVMQDLNLRLNNFFVSNRTFASVYNSLGKLVIYKKLDSEDASLNVEELDNGFYLIRIDNGSEIENHQFVKQ